MLSQMSHFPRFESKDLRVIRKRTQDGIETQLLVVQTPFGYRRAAAIFCPEGAGPYAAILYVHWYEPESPDSNAVNLKRKPRKWRAVARSVF